MNNQPNNQRWKQALTTAQPRFTKIAQATGAHWEQESLFAMQVLANNDYLQKTDPVSIRDSIINVATVGLTLNPAHQMAYLVPRDGKCCLDISYRGMLKIATDSGSVRHASVELVYSQDQMTWRGKHDRPVHEFNPFAKPDQRGEFVGAYIIAKLSDGDWLCDHMSADEIYKVRDCSKAYLDKQGNVKANSPWARWFAEMVKKTIIKRASKTWPQSQRLQEAAYILNQHEGIDERFNAALDVTPRRRDSGALLNDDQAATIEALIEEVGADRQALLADLSVESIVQIPKARYALVVDRLRSEDHGQQQQVG